MSMAIRLVQGLFPVTAWLILEEGALGGHLSEALAANPLVYSSLQEDVGMGKSSTGGVRIEVTDRILYSDDCRFPHVLPENQAPHNAPFFGARGGHRPRPAPHMNGFAAVEEKLAALSVQDVGTRTLFAFSDALIHVCRTSHLLVLTV